MTMEPKQNNFSSNITTKLSSTLQLATPRSQHKDFSDIISTPYSYSPAETCPPNRVPQSHRQRRKGISPAVAPPLPPPCALISAIAEPYTMATRLLVVSIGNPAPYLSTYHSAGHLILNLLPSHLGLPPFAKSRAHGGGLLSSGGAAGITLYQSPSLMNVSGPAVSQAWRKFLQENGCGDGGSTSAGQGCRLVVVHDELELGVGLVNVRKGDASPKGHNGLKSIKASMRGTWTRIGVGIGRPVGRERDEVSRYVLGKMQGADKGRIEGAVGGVVEQLRAMGGA